MKRTTYLFLPPSLRHRDRGRLTKCFRVTRPDTYAKWKARFDKRRKQTGLTHGWDKMPRLPGVNGSSRFVTSLYSVARSEEALFRLPEFHSLSVNRGPDSRFDAQFEGDGGGHSFENAVRAIEDR